MGNNCGTFSVRGKIKSSAEGCLGACSFLQAIIGSLKRSRIGNGKDLIKDRNYRFSVFENS